MSELSELIKAERSAADLNGYYEGGNGTGADYRTAKAATDAAIANLATVSLPDRETVLAVLSEGLGDTYSCTRVWEAWQYGTMTQDDFSPASEDEELLDGLADTVLAALSTQPAAGEVAEITRLSDNPTVFCAAKADAWDECLDTIEENELNTEQARTGNPYRSLVEQTEADRG